MTVAETHALGLTLADLEYRTLDRLHQKDTNYDRYSQAAIQRALNDAQLEAAVLTGCLKSFAVYRLRSGYAQYRPPTLMLSPTRVYFYHTATSYWELPIVTRGWLDIYKRGWRTQTGDPLYMFAGDMWQNMRKIGLTPFPNTNGSDYTVAMDDNLYFSGHAGGGITTTGNVSGTVNGAHATNCVDASARTLSNHGVKAGMIILNHTDGSWAQITSVTASTIVATLAGGSANTWGNGDYWVVLCGDWGSYIYNEEERYIFTRDMTGAMQVETLTNMLYLEYVRRPLKLQFTAQYPELPPELHAYLAEGAVWILKRSAPRGSDDFNEAMAAQQIFISAMKLGYSNFDSMAKDSPLMRFHL